jgi:hypothetical protein
MEALISSSNDIKEAHKHVILRNSGFAFVQYSADHR